ncbi:formin-like protein 18 isoform X2 [Phoenix dactylifera]|uniref:Formin-like protein 18 isoform X2 n=1 Tax=Phoenix dactylifera TaxID=42345 RepID=A0A8B8ZG64_PHODC|nr:formin-like protein 18 isoform X2 [Phoenix dactylifera]XP_038977390.1 formin-like protein 18 isoform X2 [Phoenix dactylifera]
MEKGERNGAPEPTPRRLQRLHPDPSRRGGRRVGLLPPLPPPLAPPLPRPPTPPPLLRRGRRSPPPPRPPLGWWMKGAGLLEEAEGIVRSITMKPDVMNFSPNPYFEDTKLVKTYSFTEEGTTNITGTTIKWKEGMDIANGNGHEKKGSKRPLTEESCLSFHP